MGQGTSPAALRPRIPSEIFDDALAGPPKASGRPWIPHVFNFSNTHYVEAYFTIVCRHAKLRDAATPASASSPGLAKRLERWYVRELERSLGLERVDNLWEFAKGQAFSDFDTRLPVSTTPPRPGRISFLLTLAYRACTEPISGQGLRANWSLMTMPNLYSILALGQVDYLCAFDYTFYTDKNNSFSMLIQPAGSVVGPLNEKHEFCDGIWAAIDNLNSYISDAQGPRYIRISPSLAVRDSSGPPPTFSLSLGPVSMSGIPAGGKAAPSASGYVAGSFTVDIHMHKKKEEGPPQDFINDMAVAVFYPQAHAEFTDDRKKVVYAWISLINRKYPQLADAVRDGKLKINVDGYASKEGKGLYNQDLSYQRATPVKRYIATNLSVPDTQISVKPFGAQFATYNLVFDTRGGIKKVPNPDDRAVVAYIDKKDLDAAWKIVKGSR